MSSCLVTMMLQETPGMCARTEAQGQQLRFSVSQHPRWGSLSHGGPVMKGVGGAGSARGRAYDSGGCLALARRRHHARQGAPCPCFAPTHVRLEPASCRRYCPTMDASWLPKLAGTSNTCIGALVVVLVQQPCSIEQCLLASDGLCCCMSQAPRTDMAEHNDANSGKAIKA